MSENCRVDDCQKRPLTAEIEEWKQAASVEAGLRREFLARAERAEEKLGKVVKWLERLAVAAERGAQNCSYESLREAYIADSKNYRKTIADILPVLEAAQPGAAVSSPSTPE